MSRYIWALGQIWQMHSRVIIAIGVVAASVVIGWSVGKLVTYWENRPSRMLNLNESEDTIKEGFVSRYGKNKRLIH